MSIGHGLGGERTTVGELAAVEGLRVAPSAAYPAELTEVRTVSPQALVAFRGNRYSVPPGMPGAQVMLRRRLGADEPRGEEDRLDPTYIRVSLFE